MNSNILNIVNIVTIFLWVSLVHIVFSDKKNKKGNLSLFLILSLSIFLSNCDLPTDESSHPCNEETSTQVKEGPLAVGCPNANYPDWETSPYVLPYPVGESYSIDLSNCSSSFHNEGRPDQFAIDFDMKIGTLITASRAGVVVHVVENGIDGSHPNNLVVVDHGDKTFAEYMHLTQNGALVKVGDIVKQGDEIGLSGRTGLAGYPHLHFVVTSKSWEWPYISVPVTFSNTISNVHSLNSGNAYEAYCY